MPVISPVKGFKEIPKGKEDGKAVVYWIMLARSRLSLFDTGFILTSMYIYIYNQHTHHNKK